MGEWLLRPQNNADMASTESAEAASGAAHAGTASVELHLITRLRSGDEVAFSALIDLYHTSMLRLAMVYISPRALAEEVVQDAWLGVLKGLKTFEGRSSLKTWIFRILTNCAKTRAQREGRTLAFSSLETMDVDADPSALDPDRFQGADGEWPGHWRVFPADWNALPEQQLLSQETRGCILRSIETLSPRQREVITLRDIEGCSAEETCQALGISEQNQRVLLHRARLKLRQALEQYFEGE
jgi:RNA polymerase sigma-70 factor (ECF subfamily)